MPKVQATKLTIGLPFGLGELELEPNEAQQRAAWELYVELSTRIATQPLNPNEGLIREALTSLYTVFAVTRDILRRVGPSVVQGPNSLGPVAIEVLNKGIRPFTAKWHPLLLDYEAERSPKVSARIHEQAWEKSSECRKELAELQKQMMTYKEALAKIAEVELE